MSTPSLLACALLALAPAAPAARAAAPLEARTWVERVVQAYGGWERLRTVQGYRLEGSLFALQRHESARTIRIYARPDRLKVLIEYPDGHEARLFDGRRSWRAAGGGGFEPSSGPMHQATVLQAARAAIPWILRERVADARLVAPLEHGGARLPGIEIALGDGLLLRAYADPVTWRVRVSQGLLTRGSMPMRFETFYGDWRKVNGVVFAFREESWASGVQTGITTVERFRVNPPMGKDEFSPPRLE